MWRPPTDLVLYGVVTTPAPSVLSPRLQQAVTSIENGVWYTLFLRGVAAMEQAQRSGYNWEDHFPKKWLWIRGINC